VTHLVAPHVHFHESFLEAARELEAEGNGRFVGLDQHPLSELEDPERFARYVQELLAEALPESPRPRGWVPATVLWITFDDTFLGRVSIRHELNGSLHELGGHIGYAVRPSARGHGVATKALADALRIAHGLGIDPALVTCDDDNDASRRVIEKNGGVLEDVREHKMRFWVPTGPAEQSPVP
jgi:predicted acetyltransferase